MKLWQKVLGAIIILGGVLFAFNQAVEFSHNMGMGHSQENLVHVDLSGNVISNTTHFVDNELLNSSGQTLTLAHTPNPASSLQLYWNGVKQSDGSGNDYVLSGNSITLLFKKERWDQFHASYKY